MKDRLLTVGEIANYLGVQQSTIYKWTHQEFIPHVKIGKFVRFKTDEVDDWISKKSVNGRANRKINVY